MPKYTRMHSATPRTGIYRHKSCQASANSRNKRHTRAATPQLKEFAVLNTHRVPHRPTAPPPAGTAVSSKVKSKRPAPTKSVTKSAAGKRCTAQAPVSIAHIRAVVNLAGGPSGPLAEDATANQPPLGSTPLATALPPGLCVIIASS
eukprot:gene7895-8091_t